MHVLVCIYVYVSVCVCVCAHVFACMHEKEVFMYKGIKTEYLYSHINKDGICEC